jgi:hypothetical protein
MACPPSRALVRRGNYKMNARSPNHAWFRAEIKSEESHNMVADMANFGRDDIS